MDFDSSYAHFVSTGDGDLLPVRAPLLSYPRLTSLIRECPSNPPPDHSIRAIGCSGCDDVFFGTITRELTDINSYFRKRVQWLLEMHLAPGLKKALFKLRHKQARNSVAMIQEGQKLVRYAAMMTVAIRKLLVEYDQIHNSREGSKFKGWLTDTHKEVVQSLWLIELLALYFNFKLNDTKSMLPELCEGCTCEVVDGKVTLSFMPHETLKIDAELTCPICLETLFEPTALKCGHMFCWSCACNAAQVPTYLGLKTASLDARCPLCRESSVFCDAIQLTEIHLLIHRRCNEAWKARCEKERKERMAALKEYWSYRPEDVGSSPFHFI